MIHVQCEVCELGEESPTPAQTSQAFLQHGEFLEAELDHQLVHAFVDVAREDGEHGGVFQLTDLAVNDDAQR
jgi:hypothetical protein